MGLFDTARCSRPLPDGLDPNGKGVWLQTKSLYCSMEAYEITEDGRLIGPHGPMQYHGYINFYTSVKGDDGKDRWHEYVAKFTDGRLDSIELGQSPWA